MVWYLGSLSRAQTRMVNNMDCLILNTAAVSFLRAAGAEESMKRAFDSNRKNLSLNYF
jgi:hypothetical protein